MMVTKRERCPDDGACHHECGIADPCFRVRTCEPLSGVYPDDRWPDEVVSEHNLLAGLYIHHDIPRWKVRDPEGVEHTLVDAKAFMEVQRERDDYRRVCALVNAWRHRDIFDLPAIDRLLNSVGLTYDDARAMNGLIQWAKQREADRA